jgi:hypothetical protein
MATKKKKVKPTKTSDLPGINGGPGVTGIVIPAIDTAVDRYENKKDERCKASPGEIAAKGELKELLAANRDQLPVNKDGQRFYRRDGVDYILDEVLKRHSVTDDSDDSTEGE